MRTFINALVLATILSVTSVAQSAATQPSGEGVWRWFESCKAAKMLAIDVVLDGRPIHHSRFPVCLVARPSAASEQRKLVFRFKGGHVFQGEYRTEPTQTVEATVWQAGGERNALLLGISFVNDRVLLNTMHIAKPDRASTSTLDRGIVVRTYPETGK